MRLFDRYVCQHFLRLFWLGLGLYSGLCFLVELFDRIDEFIERQVLWSDALRYLLWKLPGTVSALIPAAFLLASILTFSTLNRYHELTAMQVSGVSPLRLARPLFLLGAAGSLFLVGAQEYLVPYTNQAYRQVWRTRIRHQKLDARLGLFQQGHIWYRRDNRIWSIQLSQPLANRLVGVTIYELDAAGGIRQRYDAAEARWDPQGWTLQEGVAHTFTAEGMFSGPPEAFTHQRLPFPERPGEISALRKEPDEMGLREGLAYARQLRRQHIDDFRYIVAFHGQLAFAAACIMMAGFGLPLALLSNRSGGRARAIGLALVSGFGYWVLHSLALAMGQDGRLPPVVAAWSANSGVAIGGLVLAWRLR